MTDPFSVDERVNALLNEMAQAEPTSYDLGTPEVMESEATNKLVEMGPEIVPILLERIQNNAPSKIIAYVVFVLNQIGDARALEPLITLSEQYRALENKDEWDYAVIGQCRLAIDHLKENTTQSW